MAVVRALALVAVAGLVSLMGAISDGSTTSAATVASVDVQPGLKNAVVGDAPFNVTVQVNSLAHETCIGQGADCSPSVGLAAFEFDIRYDGDVVDIRGAEQGPDLGKTGREFQCFGDDDEDNDVFTFGCFSPGQADGLQGSAVLARVQVAPVGRGNSWIDLEGELSGPYSEDIPADFKRAAVIVENRPGGPNGGPQPQSGQTPDGDETPGSSNGEPTVATNPEGTPLSPEEVIATATAQARATEEGGSLVSGDDGEPGEGDGGTSGDSGDDGEGSSSSSGDDGGGSSFVTVMLITLGVIAGAAALGAGGFAAWRVRNGG